MVDRLAEAFRAEIPCDAAVAAVLAAHARAHPSGVPGGPEDTDEDLVLRFRDPRIFGAFAEALVRDPTVAEPVRRAALEHAFDLLPLPRTEGDVIQVETRAPPQLLALAQALAREDGLTVLHVMHLVYAVFLDRSLVAHAPRSSRSQIVHAIWARSEAEEGLRTFYAALHLSTVPEREAVAEFRDLVGDETIPASLRESLVSLAASEDGGRNQLTRIAQKEGLLPADLTDAQSPEVIANIPRLPDRLAEEAEQYVARSRRA